MSYLVIARKWRPQTFTDIAGQEHISQTLQNAIRANRIAHAYLFTGVRGVGKTTAARILAKALNCATGPTATPCNQCSHCLDITQGSSIDVLEIDGASNRGIDEIRQIIENVRYQPAQCRFKIYIIDEVHQVTKDAFNAILKTLEEPPPSVKFILATTEPHRLPDTILSRCQRYDFRRIPLREIVQRLARIAASEGLRVSDGALVLLAREADGSMRDAQSLLEQVLACAEPAPSGGACAEVDEALLENILGLAQRRTLYQLSAAVIAGDARRAVELVAQVVSQGRDLNRLARDLVEHFRNLLVARLALHPDAASPAQSAAAGEPTLLLDLPDQEIGDLGAQVKDLSIETLLDYFEFMAAGDEEIVRSATPRFALESVLIRLANLPKTIAVAEMVERLERLAGKPPGQAKPTDRPLTRAEISPPSAAPPERASAVADDGVPVKSWSEFVAFVGREQKFLASHLGAAVLQELSPTRLTIGVNERHHLAYLQDNENQNALKDIAKRFFSRELALQINSIAAAADRSAVAASPEGSADRKEPASDLVKEAVRIFGGAVRNMRRDNG